MQPKNAVRFDFFQRMCLTIPDECGKNIFSFEKYEKNVLLSETIESIEVESYKRCLDFCLTNSACRAVNFNIKNG